MEQRECHPPQLHQDYMEREMCVYHYVLLIGWSLYTAQESTIEKYCSREQSWTTCMSPQLTLPCSCQR